MTDEQIICLMASMILAGFRAHGRNSMTKYALSDEAIEAAKYIYEKINKTS